MRTRIDVRMVMVTTYASERAHGAARRLQLRLYPGAPTSGVSGLRRVLLGSTGRRRP